MKITTKTTINFSFYKLAKFIDTKKYLELKSKATIEPMVDEYKKFIKSGKVKNALSPTTIARRRARKNNPSIGGAKPLYDTGKLVNSLRYGKAKQAVYAVDYAKSHIDGIGVPQRDFITQTHEALDEKGQLKAQSRGTKQLVMEMRKRFRRKLAK